jgi:hypothetical protein
MKIGKETEIIGENLPHCNLVHYKSKTTLSAIEQWPPLWEASD